MCIGKLSHMIRDVVEDMKWDCVKAGRSGPKISHMMFADDLLLFRKATENQVTVIMDVLNTFWTG